MEPEEIDEVEELEDQSGGDTKPAKAEPAKDPDKEAARELREENKLLRARVSEAEDNVKFWHGKAAQTPKAAKAEEAEAEDKPLSADLVDAISSGDTKLVKKLFREMGFASDRDVDNKIGQTRAQITEESKLYGKYPDLQDNQSEFFKSAAKHYNDLAQDPTLAKSPKLIEIAARLAKAELGDGEEVEERRAPKRRDPDEDAETDRVRRVSTQSGPRGGAKARETADNNVLSAAQASIVKKFQEAGSDLTVERYTSRANRGVRMSGRSARRAA
jgi:hypothetical protein